jgi:hypothetical protein
MDTSLISLIPYEEFDHQTLVGALSSFKSPRNKITSLLRNGTIIRIKSGFYIFGETQRRGPYSKEILANLMYGPSYVSLEYALSHYGLIPERVEVVTSVTTKRSKSFKTPVGIFSYRFAPTDAYRFGITTELTTKNRPFLISIPEKALADKLRFDHIAIRSQRELGFYLFENLRLDKTLLTEMNAAELHTIANRCKSNKVRLLAKFVMKMQIKVESNA